MTPRPRPLPPHLIRRDDVPAWLAGSAVRFSVVHQTQAIHARQIIEEGIRIDSATRDLSWGIGFYGSTRRNLQYGESSVEVAIRIERPFVVEEPIVGQERVDALCAAAANDDVRAVLLAAGYDGVVVHFGQAETWVVAYTEDQVKAVVER